ncbi:MAG: family 10 glycosylhydrolase [Paludibacteraceae bacterium]
MKTPSKSYIKLLFSLVVCLLVSFGAYAQEPPKREIRATWLTTVWRIDWPSTTVPANGTSSQRTAAINTQKNELTSILDKMKQSNMNAVFFQVRSMSDAMYQSSYENWSSFISSERGVDPGWDPLAFAIQEAHTRGMELHAWINPYRYSSSSATHGNLSTDYANSHPEWLIAYDSYTKILNPGIPEVTQRIVDVITEIVTNYDVDGIVFDDYFYGNGVTNNTHDQAQFDAYNPDGLSRADWRRENCNKMIKAVHNKIQEVKPYVTFGVSPAGVAASSATVAAQYDVPPAPVGSDWQYNGIYSDPLAWLSQGSIDYISPQLYWTTSSSIPYDILAPWWSMVANKFGKHFYASHSLSAMTGSDPNAAPAGIPQIKSFWIEGNETNLNSLSSIEKTALAQREELTVDTRSKAPAASNFYFQEVGIQVAVNRSSDLNGAPGSVFYATAKAVGTSFLEYLQSNVYNYPSLTPSIGWKKASEQLLVSNLGQEQNAIYWTNPNANVRFAVYAVPNANRYDPGVFSSSKYLLGISYYNAIELPESISTSTHKIAVAVLDRFGNEFSPRVFGEDVVQSIAAQLTYPANGASTVIPTVFKWQPVEGADSYVWEVANDASFDDMFCARETTSPEFNSGLEPTMQQDATYYWRVRTRKANMQDSYSQVFSFVGEKFQITLPQNGATEVSLTPSFTWMNISSTANYVLEISTTSLFESNDIVYSQSTNNTAYTIPENVLLGETTYYARVHLSDGILDAISEVMSFRTMDVPIPIPVITSPANNSSLFGTVVDVQWQEQPSKGFSVELSSDPSFPPRNKTIKRTDAYVYSTSFAGLQEGTYYIQVKALNNTGTTEPSEKVKIYTTLSSINEHGTDDICSIYKDSDGQITLMVKGYNALTAQIEIYTVSGILIHSNKQMLTAEKNYFKLDLNNSTGGVYILRVNVGDQKKTIKIVI